MTTRASDTPRPATPTEEEAAEFVAHWKPIERRALFGVLVAQIHDVHALAYTFSDDEITAAERICTALEGQPGALAEIAYLSAAVTAHEIDHPLTTDAQTDAGVLLLAELEKEFGPVYAG